MIADKFRVLVLADSRSFHTERYVSELRRQDCRVLMASLEHGKMHHYPLKRRGPFGFLQYSLAVTELSALIARFEPDIINPHFASGYGFMAALAKGRSAVPIYLNLWGSDILIVPAKSVFHKRKTAYALRAADFISADSKYIFDKAAEICPLPDSTVIPWGIEERFLELRREPNSFGSDRPLRIIVPRPHEEIYNNAFIVRALAPLINAGKIEVTFPSFGSLVEKFRRQADSVSQTGIHFYDKKSREDFLKIMAEHDIYLSAARSDSSPVSLIEAMALGLIPVAANIPGVREWLVPSSGFTYEPFQEEDLRKTIDSLAESDENYDEILSNNYNRVRSEAVFEKNVGEAISIMKRLAKGDGPR